MVFILINWLLSALAIVITSYILPGIVLVGFIPALLAALVLGFINSVIRPILIVLTLPINILTLGLFTLVINALLILLTSALVPGFHVKNFWWAVAFAIILSLVHAVINMLKKSA